jgi:FkbM family methyltransferase
MLAALTGISWGIKQRIASRPRAWRYYSALCRRAGWSDACLGWHTPVNGPFAGIRTQAFHANHLWVLVGAYEVGIATRVLALLDELKQSHRSVEVWDLGANHGRFALLCARHGATRVLAVEPSGANTAVIRQHLAANPELGTRIEILAAAVSNQDGSVDLVVNERDGAVCQIRAAGVREYEPDPETSIHQVGATCLDSLAETRGRAPEFIKIDVEGAEALVLEGASRLLAAARPIVLIEIHNVEAGRACLGLLERARYSSARIEADGALAPIAEVPSYGHLLARPRE